MTTPSTSRALAPSANEGPRLVSGEHHDPHAVLGAHPIDGGMVIRAFHPDASAVDLLPVGGSPLPTLYMHLRMSGPDGRDP